MYRFLDRRVDEIDEPQRFLLAGMRLWVEAARGGRCTCRALAEGFANRGASPALRDFTLAMASLDRDGLGALCFGHRCAGQVGEDEARVLALFSAGLAGIPPRVRRIAATLVTDEAAPRLANAVEWVALHLNDGTFVERDT